MEKNIFGIRLKNLIKEKDITQKDFARDFDITQATVSRYIKGNRIPNSAMLKKLADYFKVSTDYLVGDSDFRTEKEVLDPIISKLQEFGFLNSDNPSQKEIDEIADLLGHALSIYKIKSRK